MTKQSELAIELQEIVQELETRKKYNYRGQFYPDTGEYRRELYPRHMEFMASGKDHPQRAFIAPNRAGKTLTGALEMSYHLTGDYPDWWAGRKFKDPISAWAASVSNEATKNILQQELVGSPIDPGTGMIPKDRIVRIVKKPGVADAIETVYVKHVDGTSRLDFKSYEQGRDTFQGTKKQVIWLDEEPTDHGIFTECLTRTASADRDNKSGIIYCTFTPLFGLSDVVLSFLPDGRIITGEVESNPAKYVVNLTWADVPHLTDEWKEQALASYSPHEREARSKGIPSLGAGAIYPYSEDDVVVEPFEIPMWWPRAFGMDVGWNRTAAVWGAKDPDSGQIYLYSEHYMGAEPPAVHASAIKSRGDWIWGAVDPRADARSQVDGKRLIDLYDQEGLSLIPADNSVESGIYKIGQALASGQIKIFSTLRNVLSEYRVYRRDEKGKVVKKNDHAMDAFRYLIMTGMEYAEVFPDPDYQPSNNTNSSGQGRDSVTGY